jgi:hypothetical protein
MLTRPISVVSADAKRMTTSLCQPDFTMKRILRISLIVGLVAGSLTLCAQSSEARPFGPFRRGWPGGYGYGRAYYGPGWGYRHVYRPYGPAGGGYGLGYRNYGWGYGGYTMGYPAYGFGMYGAGYPGYGWGYPGVYGTSITIGSPVGGFYMGSYPY